MGHVVCSSACTYICYPEDRQSHDSTLFLLPGSVSESSYRVFVWYILMLYVSFSYTSRKGVTINFSAPSDCCLRAQIHLSDIMMT